jgi:hypothetical protein
MQESDMLRNEQKKRKISQKYSFFIHFFSNVGALYKFHIPLLGYNGVEMGRKQKTTKPFCGMTVHTLIKLV